MLPVLRRGGILAMRGCSKEVSLKRRVVRQNRILSCSYASASEEPKRLTVVLDMDECLIHSTNFSDEPEEGYRQDEASREHSTAADGVEKFKLELGDGVTCQVFQRPNLLPFLRACAERYDTYVFTAGTQPYADPLLDTLDPERVLLKGRFFRNHCRPVRVSGGVQYLKDLTAVTDDMRHTASFPVTLIIFIPAAR